MEKGNGQHPTPPRRHRLTTDDSSLPVATLHQHIRPQAENAGQRRVLVEPGHIVYRGEGGSNRHPVVQGVDRSIRSFAQAFHRGVAVKRKQQATSLAGCSIKQCDMAAMQEVVNAVGQDKRTRAVPGKVLEACGFEDLRFKARRQRQSCHPCLGSALFCNGSIFLPFFLAFAFSIALSFLYFNRFKTSSPSIHISLLSNIALISCSVKKSL